MTQVRGYTRRDGTRVNAHRRRRVNTYLQVIKGVNDVVWGVEDRHGVTRPADSAATIATWFLPSSKRARYAEEFREELWTLAEEGASRWRQMVHAVRLVWHAPGLYLAVRSPHRRKASL